MMRIRHPAPGVASATAALLLGLVPLLALSGVGGYGPAAQATSLIAQFTGALLASVAAGSLLVRAGVIRASGAGVAVAFAVPAWVLGALATASWGVGFEEADAGTARSWFGNATGVFFLGSWAAGTAAVLIVALAMLRAVPSGRVRIGAAALLSVPSALAIGIVAAAPVGMVLLATATLIAAGFQLHGRSSSRPRLDRAADRMGDPSRPPLTAARRRFITAVTGTTAVLGVGCVAFALTGSLWGPIGLDSTGSMRVGILAGALVMTVTVAAAAAALFPRWGRAVIAPTVLLIAALCTLAAGYALPHTSALDWPLIVSAGALTGLAIGVALLPVLPGARWMRVLLILAISLAAAATLGSALIAIAGFLAPALAAAVTVVLARRPRRPVFPRIA